MENKIQLTFGVFILASLIFSGVYFVPLGSKAYFCSDNNLVGLCEKLSSGLGTRCYFNSTSYKTCSSGWKLFEGITEEKNVEVVKVFANERVWSCEVIDEKVNSYSRCVSENREAYLGELV